MKKPAKEIPIKFLATNRGLMRCTVAEFDVTKYKGLKQNCGRTPKQTPTPKP